MLAEAQWPAELAAAYADVAAARTRLGDLAAAMRELAPGHPARESVEHVYRTLVGAAMDLTVAKRIVR